MPLVGPTMREKILESHDIAAHCGDRSRKLDDLQLRVGGVESITLNASDRNKGVVSLFSVALSQLPAFQRALGPSRRRPGSAHG